MTGQTLVPSRSAPRRLAHRRRARRAAARRRLVVLAVLALTIVAFVVTASLQSEASVGGEGDGILEATVVVGPGDTVWDIAMEYLPPGEHPHAYAARILRHNGVDASAVAPGTTLQLPRP